MTHGHFLGGAWFQLYVPQPLASASVLIHLELTLWQQQHVQAPAWTFPGAASYHLDHTRADIVRPGAHLATATVRRAHSWFGAMLLNRCLTLSGCVLGLPSCLLRSFCLAEHPLTRVMHSWLVYCVVYCMFAVACWTYWHMICRALYEHFCALTFVQTVLLGMASTPACRVHCLVHYSFCSTSLESLTTRCEGHLSLQLQVMLCIAYMLQLELC